MCGSHSLHSLGGSFFWRRKDPCDAMLNSFGILTNAAQQTPETSLDCYPRWSRHFLGCAGAGALLTAYRASPTSFLISKRSLACSGTSCSSRHPSPPSTTSRRATSTNRGHRKPRRLLLGVYEQCPSCFSGRESRSGPVCPAGQEQRGQTGMR